MRVSLNKIKEFTNVDLGVDELVDKINQQLGGVEEVVGLAERYKDALIVRVVSVAKHPNADRLTICLIDDDGQREGVVRDEDNLVQVVCGAPNVADGMLAIWLPPASVVPSSLSEGEPFKLDSREIRGVTSNGMLASARELGIGDDHDGIVAITATDLPTGVAIEEVVGSSFSSVFGMDDILIDIENKMFTHRPDLFGQIGVAREIAGIQHKKFVSPDWYWRAPSFSDGAGLELEVFNDTPEKSARFMAVAMNGVQVGPSPLWLRCELVRLGAKPINNIVDITNYVMLMTAQPVHAYDYDKLAGSKLGVRLARDGEEVKLLNKKTYRLEPDDIVIVDGEGPIGLAGVMGGFDSEVTSETTSIVLEVANFDMYAVRRSSMRHGLFTDALTRFNKGQSPLQADRVMSWLIEVLSANTGAVQVSSVFDQKSPGVEAARDSQSLSGEIRISAEFINKRLGLSLNNLEVEKLLRNVEFAAHTGDTSEMVIAAPFWRTDISLPEDIVEEVGRLYGFDRLPRELPARSIKPAPKNTHRELKQQVRESLAGAGVNEVLTYSFVHENTLRIAGQEPENSYRLTNSLSPDLQYYRQSLVPSLLTHIHANIRAGYDRFGFFELGKIHQKDLGLNEEGVPVEASRLAFVYADKASYTAAFYQAKRYLCQATARLGVSLVVQPLPSGYDNPEQAPFEPKRSGQVIDQETGQAVGVIGEFKKSVSRRLKLPAHAAGFEIDIDKLLKLTQISEPSYQPLSRYPSVVRDVCFRVSSDVTYAELKQAVSSDHEGQVLIDISPVDIYQPDNDRSYKQITFRFTLTDHEKTLTSEDADEIITSLSQSAISSCGAIVV